MRALAALLFVLPACRADVEGDWRGHVGERQAGLTLEQDGSAIEGEVCIGDACFEIYEGDLEEQDLELFFEDSSLSLSIAGARLTGEARVWGCDCEGECECREPATFSRCPGACP